MSPLKRSLRQTHLTYEEPLGPSKIYLDDLDALLDYLCDVADRKRTSDLEAIMGMVTERSEDRAEKEVVAGTANEMVGRKYQVELSAGDAVAEEVEDLRSSTPKELRRISIKCSRPLVLIHLGPNHARVIGIASSEDAETRQVVGDVARFLRARRALFIWNRALTLVAMIVGVAVLPSFAIIYAIFSPWRLSDTIGTALSVLLCLGVIAADQVWFIRRTGGVTTTPEHRKDARLLSRQTKRDIAVALLGALAGGVLGIIGTLISIRFSN